MSGPVSYTNAITGSPDLAVVNTYYEISSSLPDRFWFRGLVVALRGNSHENYVALEIFHGSGGDVLFAFPGGYARNASSVVLPEDCYILIENGLYARIAMTGLPPSNMLGIHHITVFYT